MADFKKHIIKLLSDNVSLDLTEDMLEVPPDPKMGDFAFPCFILAKEMKKSPVHIAQELSEKIVPDDRIETVQAKGPYLNFFVSKGNLIGDTISTILSEGKDYGTGKPSGRTVMVESPGPNTNKPLHLGHVRNMVLGNALVNIFKKIGDKVVRVDIVNDRGIHICKSMLAYQRFGEGKEPDIKSDHFVGKYYVEYSKRSKEDPKLDEDIYDMLKAWEDEDPKVRSLWKKMSDWALSGMKETYDRFGVKMDKAYHESDHYTKGKDLVMKYLKKGLFETAENGNIIADLEKYGLGKKVMLRADGTSIYITQDIVLGKLRYDDYKMDKMIYVVANEQIHHFKVLFKLFELFGYPFAKGCHHLAYGMIYLPEGKMKSREGTVVDADNLSDDLKGFAAEEIRKRDPEINPADLDDRSEKIGMGAIKFHILKYDPMKDFVYDPKESISFEGETGPYLQYSYARISSIIKKAGGVPKSADLSLLTTEDEFELAKHLKAFPKMVKDAAESYKPHAVCRYLLDLSQLLNHYYHKHKVIQDDKVLMGARIQLLDATRIVLSEGLNLLGIDPIDRM